MKMNKKISVKTAGLFFGSAAVLGIVASGSALAGELTSDECLINTKGGVHLKYAKDKRYWFALAGLIQADQTFFMGTTRDKSTSFPSGANLRNIVLGVTGGVGEHWSYVMSFDILGKDVLIDDTYITYSGFCDNASVSVGRVPGQFFGFDSSNSSSWTPFLEKNLVANAFYPGDGLGVMGRMWWDNGAVILTAFQPDQGDETFVHGSQLLPAQDANPHIPFPRDRWTTTARVTFSPLHDDCDVYHFGASASWRERLTSINNTPVALMRFRTYPGAKGRARDGGQLNTTARLLDTGHLRANNRWQFNVEAARQWGPVIIDGEYTTVFVHRVGDPQGSLRFQGYNIQGRYLLTGERHEYDVKEGNFCAVKPLSECGAVELAVRHDFVNLNNKNVIGGSEHNTSVGINWYLNDNVRLSGNYVRANIHPGNFAAVALNKRHLDIVALRAQVRF